MTENTKHRLDNILRKPFIYKGDSVIFSEYKEFGSGSIVVVGNIKNANLLPNEVQAFLDQLKPVDPAFIPIEKEEIPKYQFPKNKDKKGHQKQPEKIIENMTNSENTQNTESTDAQESVVSHNAVVYNSTAQNTTVKNSLLSMLANVEKDPKYIGQAKAMVDITNAYVNVQKNEISAMQIMHKINGGGPVPEPGNEPLALVAKKIADADNQ